MADPKFDKQAAYFIKDGMYVKYFMDDRDSADPLPPKPLTGWIDGLDGTGDCDFTGGRIRGAITIADKVYLFKGSKCLTIDLATMTVEICRDIDLAFPGMKQAGFGSDIDTALNTGTGKVFFFKAKKFVIFDVATNRVIAAAQPIEGNWPAFHKKKFDDALNAAVNWNNGLAYFFKGNQYAKVNIDQKTLLSWFPVDTGTYWNGLPATFAAGADSVLAYTAPTVDLASDLSDAFFKAAIDLATTELHCRPIDLLKVWHAESGVYAWNINPSPSKAAGINQITKDVLAAQGYAEGPEAYIRLTAEEQLARVVKKFYENALKNTADNKLDKVERLYQANFMPGTLHDKTKPDDVLATKNDDAYKDNTNKTTGKCALDPNNDGVITLDDLKHVIENKTNGPRWTAVEKRLNKLLSP